MRTTSALSFFIMASLLSLQASNVQAYGEGADIPATSRAMHLLTNEARCDIPKALSLCGSNCTEGTAQYGKQVAPVWWDNDLHRAAQFHATMMASVGKCLSHDSLCQLNNNLTNCDGSPACACQGGVASCAMNGTDTFDRIEKFSKHGSGEIIYTGGSLNDAFTAFYSYLHEDGHDTYGHRAIILDRDNRGVGFGDKADARKEMWDTGDFGDVAPSNSPITAGAYYTAASAWPEIDRVGDHKLWFKMHYYANSPIQKATMALNNQCFGLNLTAGSATNGTYGIAVNDLPKCAEFFFEATDASGRVTRYPTTGVLLYQCSTSWKATNTTVSCQNVAPTTTQSPAPTTTAQAPAPTQQTKPNTVAAPAPTQQAKPANIMPSPNNNALVQRPSQYNEPIAQPLDSPTPSSYNNTTNIHSTTNINSNDDFYGDDDFFKDDFYSDDIIKMLQNIQGNGSSTTTKTSPNRRETTTVERNGNSVTTTTIIRSCEGDCDGFFDD